MTTEIWVNVYTAFRALKAFQWYHGVRNLSRQLGTYAIDTRDNVAYFSTRAWINASAGKKGRKPAILSHPIVYVFRKANCECLQLIELELIQVRSWKL